MSKISPTIIIHHINYVLKYTLPLFLLFPSTPSSPPPIQYPCLLKKKKTSLSGSYFLAHWKLNLSGLQHLVLVNGCKDVSKSEGGEYIFRTPTTTFGGKFWRKVRHISWVSIQVKVLLQCIILISALLLLNPTPTNGLAFFHFHWRGVGAASSTKMERHVTVVDEGGTHINF